MASLPPHTIAVVSHTHWDREWYHPLGRMRQRLARLIDALLDDPDGLPFLLDGQSIVLDDYLAVRPERAPLLRDALRDGRVEAGPWYVLADMLLPSGEALVRNLLEGTRTVRELGGTPPDVVYSPDAFGHSAAGPVLADGFGLRVAIVWRGFGGPAHPKSTVARWTHPSGAHVMLYHLPPDGYEVGSSLPVDGSAATRRWLQMGDAVLGTNPLHVALLPNGADHHARQPDRAAAVAALTAMAAPHVVVSDTLRGFAARLVRASAGVALPDVTGELRDSAGWTWSLQGTFATRAHQKRANALVERLLVCDAEPWAALAWFVALRDEHSLRLAWKTLLATHPHDTLCGCNVDEVAAAADQRSADARAQAGGIREDALRALLGHDAAAQRDLEPHWHPTVIVRNPSARSRGGVASLRLLDQSVSDPVGPGSATVSRASGCAHQGDPTWPGETMLQVLRTSLTFDRAESPQHYPRNAVVRAIDALAWIDAMPGYGIQSVALRDLASVIREVPNADQVMINDAGHSIRNASWRLDLESVGLVAYHDTLRTFIYADGSIESVTDVGDTYTASLRGNPVIAELSWPDIHDRGPLRASWRREFTLERPVHSALPATSFTTDVTAAPELATIRATATYSLDAGADWYTIDITGENTAGDHRLRWIQPLPSNLYHVSRVMADAAFGAVRRDIAPVSVVWPAEQQLPTAPLHRWVWLQGESFSVGIVSDGLAECEVTDGSVVITLVRAVGELSRRDLPERPGHAGWPAATPDAQALGRFAARIATVVLPHDQEAALTRLQEVADAVLLPITGDTWRDVATPLPAFPGLTLEGDGLAFSAAKRSEDGDWIVLRCINQRSHAVEGTWHLPRAATEARLSRLDETPGELLPVTDSHIPFTVPAFGIHTLLVR
ncbi:MAG: hypothetical protein H7099_05170 [Gemmatimonadaceae bacterium]|nr:hypothetical protein [Gemmatimonadaceae bacterium]